jgi:hypothetical protein
VMWGGSVCECHCDGELRQAKDREIVLRRLGLSPD